MSAGMGKPQERPIWEEKFSQMFVILLSAMKPNTRLRMSLAKERDFLSYAERPDPEKDASFPDCCLCGPKRSLALTVPPVFKVGAGQLGSSCPDSQQGVMEGMLETRMGDGGATRSSVVCSPQTKIQTPEGEKPHTLRDPQMSSAVPGVCGSTAYSSGRECFS